jgi:putative ABC transport system permease protein
MARLLLAALGRLRPAGYGYGWRHGLANLRRRLAATLVQAVALALGLTALLLLTVARGDLLEAWQKRVPADAPNRFAINIQPDQRVAIADFFKAARPAAAGWNPWCAAAWCRSMGRAVTPESFATTGRASGRSRIQPLLGGADSGGQYRQRRPLAWRRRRREFSVEQGLAETLDSNSVIA